MSSMDLKTAYEIAGGYIEADEKTFDTALEVVKKHDEELAEMLKTAHIEEQRSKHIQEKRDEIAMRVKDNVLKENTEFLYNELDNNDYSSLLDDEEIAIAIKNTPFIEIRDEEETYLSDDEREKHVKMLIEKAKIDTFIEQSTNSEFNSLSDEDKRKTLFEEIKNSFLGTLVHLRTAQQAQNNIPEASKAFTDNKDDFFSQQQVALGTFTPQEKAADFNEVIDVSSDLVVAACADSENKLGKFAKKLADKAETLKGKSKAIFYDASNLAHKLKVSFNQKATEVWGQRYEFANNLRDRAPKAIMDIGATIGLVVGTATNAPWLGTAVLAYGAYKATSSWVWPLITKTRTSARLDRKNPDAPKMSFTDRFKNVTKSIFSNKEERMQYFKEAGWGSAAGLVGLGAAGAVASGAIASAGSAASAVAARTAQRLASLAVSSVNNAMNTINTLKNKKKNFWDKAFAVAGFALTAGIIAKCIDTNTPEDLGVGNITDKTDSASPHSTLASFSHDTANNPVKTLANSLTNNQHLNMMPVDSTLTEQTDSTLVFKADSTLTEQADSTFAAKTNTDLTEQQETIVTEEHDITTSAPSEWSEESGITKQQWNRLQTYWGSPEKYQEYYARITDDMLAPGGQFENMTRDEVLFRYERLTSWNLPQHRDDIARLDAFFGGCNDYLANENAASLNDVLDNGSIRDVEGTECVRATGRDVNCSGKSALHVEKIDCGCEEVANDATPTGADVVSDTKNDTLEIKDGKNVTTDLTEEKSYNVNVIRTNNLDVEHSKTVEKNLEISDVKSNAKNMNIVTNVSESLTSTTSEVTSEATEVATSTASEASSKATEVVASTASEVTSETTEVVASTASEVSSETTEVVTSTASEVSSETTEVATSTASEASSEVVIIEGSQNVETGTPAAGNIEERGGYNYSGITEKQYNRMQTFFKDRFGENAYEDYASKITDEMRTKGGIFEGLSVEQSMFSIQQMIAWSNDKVGEFAKEINTVVDYLKGCTDSISVEDAPSVKEVIDRVNENGTIDGVTGTKNIMVRYFQAGDCGQSGTYVTQQAAEGVTNPSTEGFDRLYMRPLVTNVKETPIDTYKIVEGKEVVSDLTEEKTEVNIVRTNNLDTSDKKIVEKGLSVSDVKVKPKTMNIITNVNDFSK